ncbi:MAG: hypothetical protein AB199_02595 [Parcubacteria bacterium C7867-004]|nr:MAG: hypothetical protein AB199_02595 [Parcubacteria bacterium C7867-004]
MTNSLQAALIAANLATEAQIDKALERSPPRKCRKAHRKYGRSHSVRSFRWDHPMFGALTVSTLNFNMLESKQNGPNTWARLHSQKREPRSVDFTLMDELADGVRLLVIDSGKVTETETLDTLPEFNVPIRYEGEHRVPATHAKTGDDRDLVFIRPDGSFVNFEVSVVTRKGVHWVCGQETYCGQIVIMEVGVAQTLDLDCYEIDGMALSVVPLYEENAYPDHENPTRFRNFLKILPGATEVLKYAYRHNAYTPVEECDPAEWKPEWPELTEQQVKKGLKAGVVTFFNMVMGWGFAVCKDGEELKYCQVHFAQMIDDAGVPIATKGELPVLQPMSGVLLKYKANEEGKLAATVIRVPAAPTESE